MEGRGKKTILIFSIIIILVAVAVVLVLVLGGSNSKIKEFCANVCDTQSFYGYCEKIMEVGGDKDSCYNFAKDGKHGIEMCPGLDCEEETDQTCVTGLGGAWETPNAEGECEQTGDKKKFKVISSDEPSEEGLICCV